MTQLLAPDQQKFAKHQLRNKAVEVERKCDRL